MRWAGFILREGRRGGARRRWNRSRRIGSIEEGCALVVDDAGDSGSGAGPDVGGISEGLCVARAWGSVRAIKIFHRSSPRVVLLPDAHARSGAGVTRGRGASGATRARRWRAEIEASRATGWIREGRARGEGSSAHPGALAGHVEASSCGRACPRAGVEVRQGHDDALLVPRLQRRRDGHFSDSIARLARSRARAGNKRFLARGGTSAYFVTVEKRARHSRLAHRPARDARRSTRPRASRRSSTAPLSSRGSSRDAPRFFPGVRRPPQI